MTRRNWARYPLRVAIIGGGPGGLATAIALSKVPDVEATIYEQASVLREVGAGISIGQNSWNVLELLGVANSLTSGHEITRVLNLCVTALARNLSLYGAGDPSPKSL
jgi:salicylate hydroxylase